MYIKTRRLSLTVSALVAYCSTSSVVCLFGSMTGVYSTVLGVTVFLFMINFTSAMLSFCAP